MPPNIIRVHEEANEMGRLKKKLVTSFSDRNTKLYTPKNCQSVEMPFNVEKMAKTIGRLAKNRLEDGENVSGLLVRKGFSYQIIPPDDLHVFSQLSTANVIQRITIHYSGAFGVIKHRLKQMYESVESSTDGAPSLRVHERVTVRQDSENHLSLQWSAGPISDMVSDSIVALVLNVSREMPKVVVEIEQVKYGEDGRLVIRVDAVVAYLDKQNGEVESKSEALKERVKEAFRRIETAVKPIPVSATRS